MRIGILGSEEDAQCQAVAAALREEGASPLLIRADGFLSGKRLAFADASLRYEGESLDDLDAVYVRYLPSAYAPAMPKEGAWQLHDDWFVAYMQTRERASFVISLLMQLEHRGTILVNPLQGLAVLQDKPLQLEVLRSVGAQVPRTLITNDPDAVRQFEAELAKPVIFKPLLGGASTRILGDAARDRLEAIRLSPVIFQEAIPGADLRVMVVGDDIVSSVAIETPEQHLDFRDDPFYASGDAGYRNVELPAEVRAQCLQATRACGLSFAGIDIKKHSDDWVFLELNSSPIYLDVEKKMGHPISAAIAQHLIERARDRRRQRPQVRVASRRNPSASGLDAPLEHVGR